MDQKICQGELDSERSWRQNIDAYISNSAVPKN